YWLHTPKYTNVKVDTIYWQYTVNLRTREVHHDDGWGHPGTKGFYNEVAFNVNCQDKYYGTEDCNPHKCNPHQVSYSCKCKSVKYNCRKSCQNEGNGYSGCTENCSERNECSTCYRTEYDTCYDECPVYRDWCSYDYAEWPVTQTLSTSGDDHTVYWPNLTTD